MSFHPSEVFYIDSAMSKTAETELRQALQQSGWRYTRQRAAVLEYLRAVHIHPTAEDVFLAVRRQIPNISLATVYKGLEALVDAGLANKLAGGDGPARYDARMEAHYHLRCQDTGAVFDLPTAFDPNLLAKLDPQMTNELRRQGIEVTGYRLEVVGKMAGQQWPTDAVPADRE
jgi:Fe2+ or Zn2+ uptake regulation protein